MSKLDKLVGKGKEIEIGGIHLDIKPLTVSSLPLLMQIEKNPEVIKEIFELTLKDAVPDATKEEIENISIEHATKLMEAIMDVNQLQEMDSHKKNFLEGIKEKQDVKSAGTTGNKKADE